MTLRQKHPRLDDATLRTAVAHLARADPGLAEIVDKHGPPPLWPREPGLATLIRIILEQQVSLASGAAMYRRLEEHVSKVTPQSILDSGESGLRGICITRQKASYCIALAESIVYGTLDLAGVAKTSDAEASAELQRVKGIGAWTADCYLLMALRRPDVWPKGDIALLTSVQRLRGLTSRPSPDEAAEVAKQWSPWRAVAARILWHGYLRSRSRDVEV